MVKQEIRVGIAPSPTGNLHIGVARTALFNWLFAKQNSGSFIVRIEDTDTERSKPEYEKNILESLSWLGLNWDELYRQSDRGEIYKKYINRLLDAGAAYFCFCDKEELEAQKISFAANGLPKKYNGKCRVLTPEDVKNKMKKNAEYTIRFKTPEKKIEFNDIIRGKISFDLSLAGDFIIAKNLTSPLYNLACVIDDNEMEITHVIRSEDHLANTSKQIALQEAFGFKNPEYAHLPLILNPDRSKMSKRFAATSISEYKENGYLPESLVNFMALIGWHPEAEKNEKTEKKREKEIFSKKELIQKFSLRRVQKGGAAFNMEKLDWINNQYIKSMSAENLFQQIQNFLEIPENFQKSQLLQILDLLKEKMSNLKKFKDLAQFFFTLPDYPLNMLIWKETPKEEILSNLKKIHEEMKLLKSEEFEKRELENILRKLSEERGRGEIFWPLRVALSGLKASPGPIEIMEILGKDGTLERLEVAIRKMEKT